MSNDYEIQTPKPFRTTRRTSILGKTHTDFIEQGRRLSRIGQDNMVDESEDEGSTATPKQGVPKEPKSAPPRSRLNFETPQRPPPPPRNHKGPWKIPEGHRVKIDGRPQGEVRARWI